MLSSRNVAVAALHVLLAVSATATAADPPAAATTTPPPAPAPAPDPAQMGYALGYQIGLDLAGTPVSSDSLLKGVEDGRKGTAAKLSPAEMESALRALQASINEQRVKQQAAAAQKALADGKAYLASNAQKDGVKTTASGLQYSVQAPGTGRTPTPADTVTVHYRGTLVDGTEFDSSYKRGEPATFPVGGVIPGWTEALQLMKEGAKFKLAIPPSLAYGDQGPLANQVLLFDVELLKVEPAAAQK